jgi:hypothetical protein
MKDEYPELYDEVVKQEEEDKKNLAKQHEYYSGTAEEEADAKKWNRIVDDVNNKKITLKSLSSEFGGKTPSLNDLNQKNSSVQFKLNYKIKQAEATKDAIRTQYPGLYKQMFGVAFQRGKSQGLQQSKVQTVINKALESIPNAPKVNVVQSNQNCPEEVQTIMEREGIDDAMGFTYKGEVYLVADNLRNEEEVLRTLAHELTHSGLGKFFQRQTKGKIMTVRVKYEALMDSIYRAHSKEIEQLAKTTHTHLDTRTVQGRRQASEEWLCNQTYEAQPKWYDKLVAIFNDLLRAVGLDVKLSNAEVRVVLQDAFKEFGSEGVSFMTAWHGSPYDFDKFSKDKIGTGEGAQAYGHGLYFAGKREVAEFYKKKLSGKEDPRVLYEPVKAAKAAKVLQSRIDAMYESYEFKDDLDRVWNKVNDWAQDPTYWDFPTYYLEDAGVKYDDVVPEGKQGRLYQVELAPAEDEYLLWDKPLSEQSEKVKAALDDAKIKAAITRYKNVGSSVETAQDIYHALSYKIGEDYFRESNGVIRDEPDDKAVSDYLHSLGIRGIKYLDGSSRPTDVVSKQMKSAYDKFNGDIEKAVDHLMKYVHETPKEKEKIRKMYVDKFNRGYNYNYVIFDESDIEVTAKFQRREKDARYLDLAKDPVKNQAELQKMVDEALDDSGAYWHGTPSGDLRGGVTGLHVGTKRAATEALEARIGIPADGKGWNGDREYGKTLLAGKKRIRSEQFGKYRETGYNVDAPEEDFYPTEITQPMVSSEVPVDYSWKPYVRPVLIVGKMTNSPQSAMADSKANATMGSLLKRGMAKNGYFYVNEGEDTGSVSAVLPNGEHTRVKLPDPITYDDNGNIIPLSERFNPKNEDIRFQRQEKEAFDEASEPTPPEFDLGDLESKRKELDDYVNRVRRSLEFPEMVMLARDLLGGKFPIIMAKLRSAFGNSALGKFIPQGEGNILLKAGIFSDIDTASKVLAHEIGHLVDYLPNHLMTRGNILGRIASLNR